MSPENPNEIDPQEEAMEGVAIPEQDMQALEQDSDIAPVLPEMTLPTDPEDSPVTVPEEGEGSSLDLQGLQAQAAGAVMQGAEGLNEMIGGNGAGELDAPEAPQETPTEPEAKTPETVEPMQDKETAKPYSIVSDIAGLPKAIGAGVVKSGLETYDAFNEIALGNDANPGEWRKGFEGYYSNLTGVSSYAATIAQWGASFVGVGKFAKLAGIAKATTRAGQIGQAAAAGAAADFLAFDGHDKRLSNLIQEQPALANPVNAYLAANDGDGEAEGRLKSALEGLGIGATVDVVFAGIKAYRARGKGDAAGAEAAVDEAMARFEALNKQAPAEPVPAQAAASSEVVADGAQVPKAEDPNAAPKATDQVADVAAESQPTRPLDDPTDVTPTQTPVEKAQGSSTPSQPVTSLPQAEVAAAAKRIAERVKADPEASFFDQGPQPAKRGTFDSLTSDVDLRAIIHETEKEVLQGIEGSLTNANGRVSVEESQRLAKHFAEMTGTDGGVLLNRMAGDATSIQQLHARLLAYDQVTRTMSSELRDIAVAVRKGEPGTYGTQAELELAFQSRLASYAQVQDWLKGVRSETGRTLAIMRHSRKLGPELNIDPGIGKTDGSGRTVAQLAEAVLDAGGNPSLTAKVADPGTYARYRDGLTSLFIKNILSGPTTQLVNVIGNTTAVLAHPATKIIGGGLRGNREIAAEGVKQYAYMVTEANHAIQMAVESYKRGHNILDPQLTKLGNFHEEALEASKFGINPDGVAGKLFNGYAKALDGVSTRPLTATDEFFKQLTYSSEVMSRAWSEGTNLGLKGDELNAFVKQKRDESFEAISAIGSNNAKTDVNPDAAAALDKARYSTFTNNVKEGGVAGHILFTTNKWPELKFVVPFVRVVANLLNYSASMTPGIAGLTRSYKDAVARGGRDKAEAEGRLAIGYSIWTSAVALAASGKVTGPGPEDFKKRQMLEQTGWRPNSLKVGDNYIDLKRLDPYGLPFNMAGAVMERWHEGGLEEQSVVEMASSVSMAIFNNLLDRNYMKGISDLFEAIGDEKGNKLNALVSNLGASLVVPNFVRQVATTNIDPYMHEAKGFVESVMRRTPILSSQLATKRMPWGEKFELAPGLYTKGKPDDPVMVEFARLLETGAKGSGQPLPRMRKIPGDMLDLASIRLDNGKLLYDEYGDRINQPKKGMPPIKDALTKLIKSKKYKDELIDGDGSLPGTKLKEWQKIFNEYRTEAWDSVLKDFPEVREKVFEKRNKKAEEVSAGQRRRQQLQEFIDE